MKNIELIEAFYEGRLDAGEHQRVQDLLTTNPELKEELELYKTLVGGIKSLQEDEIKSQLNKIDVELDDKHKNLNIRPKSIWGIPFSIAATLTLIFLSGGYWIYQSNFSDRAIAYKYYVEDPGLPVLMSAGSNKAFDEAMNHYKLNQFQESFEAIQPLLQSDTTNDTLLYYSGVNLLKMGKPQAAKGYFQKVTGNSSSEFFMDAQYRLAICSLITGNKDEALKVLLSISHDQENPYRESAQQMLQ